MKVKNESEVNQSCLTLSHPMDCSLPGSSVHGIFQARVLEWGAIAFLRDEASESHHSRVQLSSHSDPRGTLQCQRVGEAVVAARRRPQGQGVQTGSSNLAARSASCTLLLPAPWAK
ncbi:unnamed protein product [Rangifer tarandus platyrhynchus]|uniref:Uncharacterized protein n=1 Tax=Rangifer tarandus platyrhynchus TaxID=3082113 RepID=A0AC59ZJM0_RANTA